MKELLIVNNDTYAHNTVTGADAIASLSAGSIAVFDESGTLVDPANPNAALTGDRVYMAVGLSGAAPYLTSLINRATFEYNTAAYVAPVAKIMYIGEDAAGAGTFNLPTLAAGQVATLVIWDKSKSHEETNKASRVYSHVMVAGSLTDLAMVTGLIAAINADTDRIVNAAAVTTDNGIKLTGITAGVDFTVTPQDILANAKITRQTSHLFGTGTPTQISGAELQALVRRGKQNSFLYTNELWSLPSNLESDKTYGVIVCNWKNATEDALQISQPTYKKELIIAIEATKTTVAANIATILAAI